MDSEGDSALRRSPVSPSVVVVALGAALFAVTLARHVTEARELGSLTGPGVALVVAGSPAVVLAYLGVRLDEAGLPPMECWRVAGWALGGAVAGGGIVGLTQVVRSVEGRAVAEPLFPLLTVAGVGGVLGFLAGYRGARARTDARRAETATEALAFVNGLIRHDLRNDLVSIRGYAQRLDGSGDPAAMIDTKTDEALSRLETTRAVAATLTGDADLERVDLASVVETAASDLRQSVQTTIEVDCPAEAPVLANQGVRSVVDNVVENAVEHNDADDDRVDVDVTVDGERVRLTVADNGPGLPEDVRAWLNGTREADHEGGLSITRRLLEEYGADLRVEDRDPRGTLFRITFDRAVVDTGRSESTATAEQTVDG